MNLDAYYDDLYERTETSAEHCEYCDAMCDRPRLPIVVSVHQDQHRLTESADSC